jgi:pyridoxal phosphate enzyme (YggS family)
MLEHVKNRIGRACVRVGRNPAEITLLAATKYANAQQINAALQTGIQVIGENRVQEAKQKFPQIQPVCKHFIGTLQSNKVKTAVQLFDVIESVDSLALASKINDECAKMVKVMPIFLEVNIAGDPKKHGISKDKILETLHACSKLEYVVLKGLMTIVPFSNNPAEARPYFRAMKALFDLCKKDFPSLETLSMGMSQDFEIAIEEGATEIRIGRLIFS